VQGLSLGKVENVTDGLLDPGHESGRNVCQRSLGEAAVVNGAELIDREIRGMAQSAGRMHADPQRLGLLVRVVVSGMISMDG